MASPGLYPRSAPRTTESRAEAAVHEALQHSLPSGWYAWHSLRLRDSRNVDAEGDFIVVDPKRGMLVLEVKGGYVEQRNGEWLQNGKLMKMDPRKQAFGFMKKLEHLLGTESAPTPSWCIATCFADTDFEVGPGQGDMRDAVFGRRDLPRLGEALQQAFSDGLPTPRPVAAKAIDAIHRAWGETWVPHVSLGNRAKDQAKDRVRLDEAQISFLDSIEGNSRVLVQGAAGSGKTLLAAEAARRSAKAGKKTLLLCFTEPLASCLKRELEGDGVRVEPIRRYAADIMRAAGITPPSPGGDRVLRSPARPGEEPPPTWSDVSIYAAEHLKEKFDTVILDEAQDFGPNDWLLVDALATGVPLWAFTDPAQAFWSHRELESSLFPATFKLPRPYRNPSALGRVAVACGAGKGAPDDVRAAMEAKELQLMACPSVAAAAEKVVSVVKALRGEGIALSDIAVISLRGQSAQSAAFEALERAKVPFARADSADADSGLIADTFLRFKGLERTAVIITDLDLVKDKREVRLHIALTRALTTAVVVASRDALRAEPVLSAGLPS